MPERLLNRVLSVFVWGVHQMEQQQQQQQQPCHIARLPSVLLLLLLLLLLLPKTLGGHPALPNDHQQSNTAAPSIAAWS
jgi:hypothetical protein